MFPTLGLGLWALIETARQGRKPAPSYRAAAALSFATLLAGLLGTFSGMLRCLRYAAEHPLEQMLKFIALGLSETLHNLLLAIIMLVLISVAYAIGHLRRA